MEEIIISRALIGSIAHALNAIPNKRKVGASGESSYELAAALGKELATAKMLPNEFNSWQETHYEISAAIALALDGDDGKDEDFKNRATDEMETGGRGAIYLLAENLTDKFEKIHAANDWSGDDYFETLDKFIREELNHRAG